MKKKIILLLCFIALTAILSGCSSKKVDEVELEKMTEIANHIANGEKGYIVPEAIKNVTFPKAMRWGGKNMRFARPIRWMVALLNDEVLPINLEGIVASNITRGHRFLGRNQIEVFSIEDYFKQLSKNSVVLDQNVRKEAL